MTRKHAFTLTELLIVIGIIAILVSILVPVVGRVRDAARGAATQNLITQLASACESYRLDNGGYPGPLPNAMVNAGSGSNSTSPSLASLTYPLQSTNFGSAAQLNQITMSENLVLGLAGGFRIASNQLIFDPAAVGSGAASLSRQNPRAGRPYVSGVNLSNGQFSDAGGSATDTAIPEFVDAYGEALPILYLRARPGARGLATAADNRVFTNGTRTGAYDTTQISGYVSSNIGVGKSLPFTVTSPANGLINHGLTGVTPSNTPTSGDPMAASSGNPRFINGYAYFLNPSVGSDAATYEARNKDTFILISAGRDRIYGTLDDITNFGKVR